MYAGLSGSDDDESEDDLDSSSDSLEMDHDGDDKREGEWCDCKCTPCQLLKKYGKFLLYIYNLKFNFITRLTLYLSWQTHRCSASSSQILLIYSPGMVTICQKRISF